VHPHRQDAGATKNFSEQPGDMPKGALAGIVIAQ